VVRKRSLNTGGGRRQLAIGSQGWQILANRIFSNNFLIVSKRLIGR